MTLKAMPKGWVLESGTLGTDLDENTSDYATGGRSLELAALASGNTIILSEPIAVGDGNYSAQVRAKLGVSVTYYVDASPAASISCVFGFKFYDASGVYLSASSRTMPVSQGRVWLTAGDIVDCPSSAQYARPYVDYSDTSKPLIIDNILPYVMPPFGLVDVLYDPLSPISALGTWYAIVCSVNSAGAAEAGSHGLDDPFGIASPTYFEVQESGLYTISLEVELDDYSIGDAFMLRLRCNGLDRYSQIFEFNTAKGTFTIPAGAPDVQFATIAPIEGMGKVYPQIAQLSGGVYREVADGRLFIHKES